VTRRLLPLPACLAATLAVSLTATLTGTALAAAPAAAAAVKAPVKTPAEAAPAVEAPPAVAPPADVPPRSVPAAPDFATEVFADPWDFSNPEDMLLDNGPTMGMQAAAIRDGQLRFDMSTPGYLSPLWGGYPGGLYLGREGGAPQNQIDASRYTRVSFSAYASQTTAAGLMWFTCEGLDPACMGGQPLELKAGWHTYDIAVANGAYGLPQTWSGRITGLRFALSPTTPTSFAMDWLRLYQPVSTVEVSGNGLSWDVDDDAGDNNPDQPGWGALPCGSPCDLSFLPPGTYRMVEGGAHSTPVTLRRPARPVILDPDAVGGADYATEAGNPWDFDSPADVASVGNTSVLGYGAKLSAVNAGPTMNDPFVWMRLPTGSIDAGRFHRLSVTSSFEGAFDLTDSAGGGSHGRIVWQRPDQNVDTVVQTKEWVTYSGTSRQTYDLNSPGIHEDDVGNRLPWSSSAVTGLRWDANEDRGPRRWTLDRVALRADDEAGTSFAIRWYDAGYAPGSTVTFYRDGDAAGFDGQPISAALPQGPGTNVFNWDTSATPGGLHHIYAVVEGPAGTGRSYATGPVSVVGPALAGQAPSPAYPITRDLGDACPQSRVPGAGFGDVPGGSVHAAGVNCVAWWGVSRGTGNGYAPDAPVTRGQMATFLAGVVELTGAKLLPAPKDAFGDDNGTVHELRINQLAEAGVLGGYSDGSYRPAAVVTRDQMATLLNRAYAFSAGTSLPVLADYFTDDAGSVHEQAINAVAGAGVAGGVAESRYAPNASVRRGAMASFLARLLDVLVAGGKGAAPVR
jgi:hypothetical protein